LLQLMESRRVWSSSVLSSGDGPYGRIVPMGPPYKGLIRFSTYPTKFVVQKDIDHFVTFLLGTFRNGRFNSVRAHHRMALVFGQDWQDLAFRRKSFLTRAFGAISSSQWERIFFVIRQTGLRTLGWLNSPSASRHKPDTPSRRAPPLTGPQATRLRRREPKALAGGAYPEQSRSLIKVGQFVPEQVEESVPRPEEPEVEIDPSSYMNMAAFSQRRARLRFLTELHLAVGYPTQLIRKYGFSRCVDPGEGLITLKLTDEEGLEILQKTVIDESMFTYGSALLCFNETRWPIGRQHICVRPHPGCDRCNTPRGFFFENPWSEWAVDITMSIQAQGRHARRLERGQYSGIVSVWNGPIPVPKTIARI